MATEEEIKYQRELNDLQQENVRLKRVDVDLSFSLLESLKEVMGIQSRTTEYQKSILKTNKDINKSLVDRLSGYNSSKTITREIVKNENLVAKAQLLQQGLSKTINAENNAKLDSSIKYIKLQQDVEGQLQNQYDLLAKGEEVDQKTLDAIQKRAIRLGALSDKHFDVLNSLEKEYVLTQLQTKEIEKQNNKYREDLKGRGAGEQILEVLGAIPGLSYIAAKAQTAINDEMSKGSTEINYFSTIAKEAFSPFNLAIATLGLLTKVLLDINRKQVEFNRETGMTVDLVDSLNNNLVNTSEYIGTVSELTKQFGFNAAFAFDQINLQSVSELVKLTGLSAEEAGNLALFSQTTGTSLEDNLDTLITQTGQINIANKSAVTQRQIFRDIGNVSKAIALSFQGNTTELGKAAQQARILGLNLDQVDKIAGSLLDIESSIAAEFEAEVISGKQLNLERARFFALTNDIEGVTRELANNQEALNSFATGTRLEQEAISQALGMSRDEMAEMIFQQRAQLGITDEQARKTAGLTQADFERLTIQESLSTSLAKIGDTLATVFYPVLEGIAEVMPAIIMGMAAFGAVKLGGLLMSLGQALASVVGIAAITNPASLLIGLGATAVTLGALYGLSKAFTSKSTEVGDLDFTAGDSRPRVSLVEGGLRKTYVGTNNDDVRMAPGATNDRNRGLSSSDINAIASAVQKGASAANINLDGGRVSSRLQVPSVINQRQYSY